MRFFKILKKSEDFLKDFFGGCTRIFLSEPFVFLFIQILLGVVFALPDANVESLSGSFHREISTNLT